jgi:ResB-like family
MSKTAARPSTNITAARLPAPRTTVARKVGPVRQCLAVAASLRLTVVLMALSIVLVFLGTLAQVDQGIFTVLHRYFRAGIAWIPFQVFVRFGQVFFGVSKETEWHGAFPFPGGWLLGGLLLANLLAAHLVRFRMTWKRSGILLIHGGLVVMMLGELVTGLFAVESKMTLAIGETVGFVDVTGKVELAFIDSSDGKNDHVTVIPGSLLREGSIIQNEKLPVDVDVVEVASNSELAGPLTESQASRPDVYETTDGALYAVVKLSEASGVDPNQREDAPLVRVTFKKKGTQQSVGSYLFTLWFYPNFFLRQLPFAPQQVAVDGKTYTVALRPQRIYKPYEVKLLDFKHGIFPGTDIAKDYTSTVQLTDPLQHEDRDVKIYMNNPLRYAGDTLYQSGFFPDDGGSVLQVVRNPGWEMPYVSCAMVSVGMLIHFGIHLLGFLRRQVRS